MSKNPALTDIPTTRRMMEGILAMEEEHADNFADPLAAFPEKSEGEKRSTKSK